MFGQERTGSEAKRFRANTHMRPSGIEYSTMMRSEACHVATEIGTMKMANTASSTTCVDATEKCTAIAQVALHPPITKVIDLKLLT